MITRILIWCLFLTVISTSGIAQPGAPSVPAELVLNDAEDYEKYQALCRKSLAWLLKTPVCEYQDKRNELNAFVLLWLSGSPEVLLDIDSGCMPFIEENEDLFFSFIHGMGLYAMSHPHVIDKCILHAHGLEGVSRVVQSSGCIKRNKTLKTIIKADRRDKLEELSVELCGS